MSAVAAEVLDAQNVRTVKRNIMQPERARHGPHVGLELGVAVDAGQHEHVVLDGFEHVTQELAQQLRIRERAEKLRGDGGNLASHKSLCFQLTRDSPRKVALVRIGHASAVSRCLEK